MKDLSIIIPVFNNWKFTKSVIDYFYKNNQSNIELIIVDNGSTDETRYNILKYNMNNLVYLQNEKNMGFGFASNLGLGISKGKNILFMNNDVLFAVKDNKWINELIKTIESNDKCLIGPTGGMIDKKTFNFLYETNDPNKEINYISGWFLCGTRKTFDKLLCSGCGGPFDSLSFFVYFEDSDLGFRAAQKGIQLKLYGVNIHHIGKQTSKILNVSKLYAEARSKFIEKWKNE